MTEWKVGYRLKMKILSSLKYSVRALLACLVVCVSFAGCADDSYHGAAARYRDDTLPMPVNVFVGEPVKAETKGHGTVDFKDGTGFEGRYIYVYAFNRLAGTDFSKTSANPANCLVDGSKDEPGSIGGKQALLSDLVSYAEWTGSDTPLYPQGEMKSVPYEFFAYHIDTIKLARENIHRTSDNINIDLTFDGSIDIMTAHSVYDEEPENNEPEEESEEEQPAEPETPEGDGTKADGESLRGYSYDTARRGIDPVFAFEHKLVQLVFEAEAGVIESRREKTLTVQDVKVESLSKANLTVAYKPGWTGDGISFDGNSTDTMQLREKDGTEIPRDHYVIQNPPPTDDTPPLRVGGSLLVAPQQSYKANVTVREVSAAGEYEDVNPIDIEFPEGFNIGCSYLVKLKLFGYMAVETTVELVPWQYGGEINLPDYEYPGY